MHVSGIISVLKFPLRADNVACKVGVNYTHALAVIAAGFVLLRICALEQLKHAVIPGKGQQIVGISKDWEKKF